MDISDLRIALFSGNYNYVRDGANQALNRLVGWLLDHGAAVRVYSPTTKTPAFEPAGDLVSLPSLPIPGRSEYRVTTLLPPSIKKDLNRFAPNIVHVSSPDSAGHSAVRWAQKHNLPVLGSVHTRFETYPRYYNMAFLEPVLEAILRRLYRKCDAIVAPSDSMAQVLREQRMSYDVGIWSRGVDKHIFNPQVRDMDWRRSLGLKDDVPVIGFLGRAGDGKGPRCVLRHHRPADPPQRAASGAGGGRGARAWLVQIAASRRGVRRLSGRGGSGPCGRQHGYVLQPLDHRDLRQRDA